MSRKKNLVQIIAACEKTEFDKIVKVYLQEVYGFHRIVQTDGKMIVALILKFLIIRVERYNTSSQSKNQVHLKKKHS